MPTPGRLSEPPQLDSAGNGPLRVTSQECTKLAVTWCLETGHGFDPSVMAHPPTLTRAPWDLATVHTGGIPSCAASGR
jgi:hypothetical protein